MHAQGTNNTGSSMYPDEGSAPYHVPSQPTSDKVAPQVSRDIDDDVDHLNSDDVAEVDEVAPPDGGWGWMVVVGAGINSMLQGSMIQTFGLLYLHFRSRYKASAVDAMWACALNQLLQGLLGPLAAWLVQRHGSRLVTIAGTLLIAIGIFSTGFVPQLGVVYITYGVLPGVGFCLTHTASFLHVSKYFEKRKARALALTSVNHGIGAFIFAPVVVLLQERYDDRGMFIILSAIFIHLFISAALYRPLNTTTRPASLYRYDGGGQAGEKSLEPLCKSDGSDHKSNSGHYDDNYYSLKNGAVTIQGGERGAEQPYVAPADQQETQCVERAINGKSVDSYDHSSAIGISSTGERHCPHHRYYSATKTNGSEGTSVASRPLVNGDSRQHQQRSHLTQQQHQQQQQQKRQQQLSDTDRTNNNKNVTKNQVGFIQMFAAVVVQPQYIALCISVFSLFTASATATSYVPAYAKEAGLTLSQAASLVSVLGVFFAVGTLLLGSLLDLPLLRPHRLYIYTCCFFTTGVAIMSVPLLSSFALLCLPVAVASAATAVVYSQLLTVLSDLLGRAHVPAGFGVVRIAGALGALTGRMVGGVLVDAVGSNSLPFFVFGALPVASSVVLSISLFHRKWQMKGDQSLELPVSGRSGPPPPPNGPDSTV